MRPAAATSPVLVAWLAVAGCATVQPPPGTQIQAQASADPACRKVVASGTEQLYCGTPEQWREFDRRVALVNAGVRCRKSASGPQMCLTAKQWDAFDRKVAEEWQALHGSGIPQGYGPLAPAYPGILPMQAPDNTMVPPGSMPQGR